MQRSRPGVRPPDSTRSRSTAGRTTTLGGFCTQRLPGLAGQRLPGFSHGDAVDGATTQPGVGQRWGIQRFQHTPALRHIDKAALKSAALSTCRCAPCASTPAGYAGGRRRFWCWPVRPAVDPPVGRRFSARAKRAFGRCLPQVTIIWPLHQHLNRFSPSRARRLSSKASLSIIPRLAGVQLRARWLPA